MRTTLALSEDVFLAARQYASKDHISIGEAVSRLARAGFSALRQAPQPVSPLKGRYSLLPARGELITSEHVYQLMEQEGI